MTTPSVPSSKGSSRRGAAFVKSPSGSGKPTVVRRGGNKAIPATHCTAKRKAFQTGYGH
jgi:hypothetical protein